ncbi:KAP family P-loop NTPase fold protein [Alicyclobacillus fastidiosus]|uniref:KAP family P-loop NTPase fold protein n=1 Tax=Alicyclobacillus fastidiosus TaxID=392011 RepID=UPI0024E15BC4|nr:P-loop NTPase fold protein [Alicyclobacillus fastidiosus]
MLLDVFSADTSIKNPELDKLDYATYAKHVAESIVSNAPGEGIVFAVNGKWGTGKSTFLEFIKTNVKAAETAPIIIEFNPWWFSDKDSLIRGFFDTFSDELSKETDCPWRLIEDLKVLCNLITSIKLPSWYGRIASVLNWTLSQFRNDVPTLKSQIKNAIQRYNKKFLIVMDDLDRLTSDEVIEVIRLIKAIADFPNVMYLLAFDKEEASKAIGHRLNIDGHTYLEKIIQVPIDLPVLMSDDLSNMFISSLQAFLSRMPSVNFSNERWNDIYHQGIRNLITKPRDISRIMNALRVNYPPIMNEVDLVDFIFIEVIRLLYPSLYEVLRNNPNRFTGIEEGHNKQSAQVFHEEWLKKFEEDKKEILRSVMELVFPRLRSVWSNYVYSDQDEVQWRKDLRICSMEHYPIYFKFGVPTNQISNEEIRTLLAFTDSIEFEQALLKMSEGVMPDRTPRIRKVLIKFEDYVSDIPQQKLPMIIKILLNLSNEFITRDNQQAGFAVITSEYLVPRLIWRLIKEFEGDREKLLYEGFGLTTSLYVMFSIIDRIVEEEQKELNWFLNTMGLRGIVSRKIDELAQSGTLICQRRLPYILNRWEKISDINEPINWVLGWIEDDRNLLSFLMHFITPVSSQTLGSVNVHMSKSIDLKAINHYISLELIITRLNTISKDERLTQDEIEVIKLFNSSLSLSQESVIST